MKINPRHIIWGHSWHCSNQRLHPVNLQYFFFSQSTETGVYTRSYSIKVHFKLSITDKTDNKASLVTWFAHLCLFFFFFYCAIYSATIGHICDFFHLVQWLKKTAVLTLHFCSCRARSFVSLCHLQYFLTLDRCQTWRRGTELRQRQTGVWWNSDVSYVRAGFSSTPPLKAQLILSLLEANIICALGKLRTDPVIVDDYLRHL